MEMEMSRLIPGAEGTVTTVTTNGSMRQRLQDLGFVPGARVSCLFRSCFGDPTAYLVHETVIALRSSDAGSVFVKI